jgi:hypothetical protein
VPAPPSTLTAGVPPAFDSLLLRALDPMPGNRIRSAPELAQALDPLSPAPGA